MKRHERPLTTDNRPIPDPTTLTTEQVDRAKAELTALFDSKLDVVTARLTEREIRYEQRFQGQELAVTSAFASSEKAIAKAEVSIEKRADATYVAVAEVTRLLGALLPRAEGEARLANQAALIAALDRRLTIQEAAKQGGKEAVAGIYALAGFLVSLLVLGGIVAAAGGFG